MTNSLSMVTWFHSFHVIWHWYVCQTVLKEEDPHVVLLKWIKIWITRLGLSNSQFPKVRPEQRAGVSGIVCPEHQVQPVGIDDPVWLLKSRMRSDENRLDYAAPLRPLLAHTHTQGGRYISVEWINIPLLNVTSSHLNLTVASSVFGH